MDIFDSIGESCIERTEANHMFIYIKVNLLTEDNNELDENELKWYSAKLN
jgi:hypothetical protein